MACATIELIPRRSSLMDLPRELRDMIYINVFSLSHTNHEGPRQQHQLHQGAEQSTTIQLNSICFDWLSFMRTNGQVADEMRQIYRLPSYHTSPDQQTWSAQLDLDNDNYTLTWTSLPCPASHVRHLSLEFKLNLTLAKFGHWDNDSKGEFGSIFQTLLELLKQISSHGPNITVLGRLPQPIVFETLNLNVSFLDEEKPYLIPAGPESIYILGFGKRRTYNKLIEDIVTACGSHVLDKRVMNVRLQGPKSLGRPKTDIKMDSTDEKISN